MNTPDLQAAWYRPWRALIERVGHPASHDDWIGRLNAQCDARGLRNAFGMPLRFEAEPVVAREGNAASPAYELAIARTGRVPTRTAGAGAWHDYFNALAWLGFPLTKAQLNRRQAQAIGETGIGGRRGPLRDALTLFDEGAALLVCEDDSIVTSLRGFDWQELFVTRRSQFGAGAHCVVFGHALLQKLAAPYKSICAHALVLPAAAVGGVARLRSGDAPCEALDPVVADALADASFGKGLLTPLPLLGIPGWWPPNETAEFYNDPQVFRSRAGNGRGPATGDPRRRA